MEHRWGQRISIAIEVRLVCRPGAIGPGILRNVSTSGAFIQTDLKLPMLTPIDIELDLNLWDPGETQRICASIVRREARGIGIEWDEFAPQVIGVLLSDSGLQNVAFQPAREFAPPLHAHV